MTGVIDNDRKRRAIFGVHAKHHYGRVHRRGRNTCLIAPQHFAMSLGHVIKTVMADANGTGSDSNSGWPAGSPCAPDTSRDIIRSLELPWRRVLYDQRTRVRVTDVENNILDISRRLDQLTNTIELRGRQITDQVHRDQRYR